MQVITIGGRVDMPGLGEDVEAGKVQRAALEAQFRALLDEAGVRVQASCNLWHNTKLVTGNRIAENQEVPHAPA